MIVRMKTLSGCFCNVIVVVCTSGIFLAKILSRKDFSLLFTYFTGNSGDEEAVRYCHWE